MKTIGIFAIAILASFFTSAQTNANPNYQQPPTTNDAQRQVAQPVNTSPSPQREIITPDMQPAVQPPQHQVPQQQNNASYQDNSKFYNKDNMPANNGTNNNIPTGNGDYIQPGYSNPINKPSTQ